MILRAHKEGSCAFCGEQFDVDTRIKWDENQWAAFCLNCPLKVIPESLRQNSKIVAKTQVNAKQRKDIAGVKKKTPKVTNTALLPELAELFDGHFTVPYRLADEPENKRHHVTIWITTRNKRHKAAPGFRRIRVRHQHNFIDVGYVDTEGNVFFFDLDDSPILSQHKVYITKCAVETILKGEDQEKYGMCWALISNKCWRCGKKLTNPQTLQLESGCGPVCDKFFAAHNIKNKPEQPQTVVFGVIS